MNTVFDLETASAQQVAEHIVRHLLTQNRQAIDPVAGQCMMAVGDMRCAAGSLLTDKFVQELRDANRLHVGWYALVVRKYVPTTHEDLIRDFQCVHDKSEVCDWRRLCLYLLDKHDLDVAFMEAIP